MYLDQYDHSGKLKVGTKVQTIIDPDPTQVIQPYHHTAMNSHHHRSITTSQLVWNEMRPNMTVDSPDFCTYTHSLVSTLQTTNYSRAIMTVIDHICIGILPQTAHTTINRYFSAFVTQ